MSINLDYELSSTIQGAMSVFRRAIEQSGIPSFASSTVNYAEAVAHNYPAKLPQSPFIKCDSNLTVTEFEFNTSTIKGEF